MKFCCLIYFIFFLLLFSCKENVVERKNINESFKEFKHNSFSDFAKKLRDENDYTLDSLYKIYSNQKNLDCNSISQVLDILYFMDQIYRDSVNYYSIKDDKEKEIMFSRKMKNADKVSIKILRPSMNFILNNKNCITDSKRFDAIWLVAVHNGDSKLIEEVHPIIEFGYNKTIVEKSSYDLYTKHYNWYVNRQ